MKLINELSTRIYLYNIAESDPKTKLEYLLAMAKDILQMKQKIEVSDITCWTQFQHDILEANRISEFYLREVEKIEKFRKEIA